MRLVFTSLVLLLSIPSNCLAQEPLVVVSSHWQRTAQNAQKREIQPSGPARAVTAENKYFQRKQRENQPAALDPNEMTIDGRSAAMEKAVQQSRTPKTDDVSGYSYTANVRNDSGKTVEVIFWEYQFAEIARPANVFRRQFLCSVKLKKGESKDVTVFSLLGPSDVVDVESLSKPDNKMFDERAIVNRIEFADGTLLQRGNWKFDDVKKAVERVTSTPWGNEMCRAL